VEIVVAPKINFVKGGILIESVTNLGCGLGGVLAGRNFNTSSRMLVATIGIIGTP
jgi:hypothetical protein